jgi:lipoyl(octanoyl) transferase
MYFVEYKDIGLVEYKEAWDYQEQLHNILLNESKTRTNHIGYFIICEHPHVYTLGKSGNVNNLLINENFLKSINATFYKTNRGGDITYHGPGQIVGYPIININKLQIGVKKYIYNIEELIIKTLKEYNVNGTRLDKATGVWIINKDSKTAKKICAIGVRVSRGITMHGFAFNINTNLQYFNYIVPCGIKDKGVTSLSSELGKNIDINEVKNKLLKNFLEVFNLQI